MSVMIDAKKEALLLLKAALGKSYTPDIDELETPPDPAMGNLAFPCFSLAKGLKKNPAEIATELAAKISPKGFIKEAEARGPYVNLFFDPVLFGTAVLKEIAEAGDTYGRVDGGGKRVMVEYAQPNTHKEIHIGHLRNFFVGAMTVEILKAAGHDVIPTTYINDLGTHVAKCLWAMKKFHEGEEPAPEDRDAFLGRVYTEATKALEDDPAAKEEISTVYRELEAGKGAYIPLWKKTRKWSLDQMKAVFKELKLPLDVWYYESALVKPTQRTLKDLKTRGIVVESEGAWIVDLEEEKLGANLLVKSDGTLLYNAKDITLALRKEDEYQPDRSIYVIDVRQSLAMRQLFATLKRMGFQKDLVHLSYELVTLPEGVMSSRKGTIIRYEAFRDEMARLAEEETHKRHPDWSDKKIRETSRAIAFAAMRFGMLRQSPGKSIVFDMKEAAAFDGFTGPYLLYTLARIHSIRKKAGRLAPDLDASKLGTPAEAQLLSILARYPLVIRETAQDLHLDRIAQYLFDLARAFSEFYAVCPILQTEDPDLSRARLALAGAVESVIASGLSLMGIRPVTEM